MILCCLWTSTSEEEQFEITEDIPILEEVIIEEEIITE
jgi:hypothetical protein